jgi:glucose-6-phosphate 1-dehydrogenase
MDLLYSDKYKKFDMPEAYERLLLEVLAADHSHFVSADELIASWRIFTPALHELAARGVKPEPYPFGSRGPAAADKLAQKHGMTKFGGGLTPYVYAGPRV